MKKRRGLLVILAVVLLLVVIVGTIVFMTLNKQDDIKDKKVNSEIDYYCEFVADTSDSFLSSKENSCYSPFSLYNVLCMAGNGTAGNSQTEILKALECSDVSELNEKYAKVSELLEKNNNGQWTEGNKVLSYNSFWAHKNYELRENTVNKLEDVYKAEVNNESDKPADLANQWVDNKTEGLIPNLFNESIEIAFVNTLYYEAGWQGKFAKTSEGLFKSVDGRDVAVTYLGGKETNYYIENKIYTMAVKKLSTGDIIFIKPGKDKELDNILKGNVIKNVLNYYITSDDDNVKDINFAIPKYNIENEHNTSKINEAFSKLGIKDLFGGGTDWHNIVKEYPENWETKAIQKVNFELNENGCKAGAASAIFVSRGGSDKDYEDVEFSLNEPFVYMVVKDGVVLFVGTMCK